MSRTRIEVGDKSSQPSEFCFYAASAPDTVRHDLSLVNNVAGRIDVGDNSISHKLEVIGNTLQTPPDPDSPTIDVSDNTVQDTATCHGNNPAVSPASRDGDDSPNHAKKDDGCF